MVEENILKLYKCVITPISIVLNCSKQSAQDLIKNLYKLTLSIDSINFIFSDLVRVSTIVFSAIVLRLMRPLMLARGWLRVLFPV